MVKYLFVTGGVLSSVGKGILTSSIGKMLQTRGLKVTVIKIDPYVNVDAGTMNPYMHGEVFVTDDGGETDLDLGWYERYLDLSLKQENNITTGSIYKAVIEKERRGDARRINASRAVAKQHADQPREIGCVLPEQRSARTRHIDGGPSHTIERQSSDQ